MEHAMKKILIGVAILCMVGGAGYRFGQYLAHKDQAAQHAAGEA
jgi:hypothetical protein